MPNISGFDCLIIPGAQNEIGQDLNAVEFCGASLGIIHKLQLRNVYNFFISSTTLVPAQRLLPSYIYLCTDRSNENGTFTKQAQCK